MISTDFFWLLLVVLLEATALYNIKNAARDKNTWLVISVVCYALIPLCLFKIVKNGTGMAITNIVWNIMSSIYGIIIGVMIFKEHMTLDQKLGAGLGLISVWLMISHADKSNV